MNEKPSLVAVGQSKRNNPAAPGFSRGHAAVPRWPRCFNPHRVRPPAYVGSRPKTTRTLTDTEVVKSPRRAAPQLISAQKCFLRRGRECHYLQSRRRAAAKQHLLRLCFNSQDILMCHSIRQKTVSCCCGGLISQAGGSGLPHLF